MIVITLPPALPRRQVVFDGALVAAATTGLLGTLIGWGDNPVRVAAGLVLSLFSPGYALHRALFPSGSSAAERFGLSIPVSIVLAVLVGAVVNTTPYGLSGNLIVLLLWVCTVAFLAVAYARGLRWHASRDGLMPLARPQSRLPGGVRHSSFRVSTLGAVAAALLIVAGGAWATTSLIAASRTTPKPFTVLAVNGANGVLSPGEPLSVTLENQEGQPMQYDLEVTVDGNVVARVEGVRLEAGSQYALTLPDLSDAAAGADVVAYQSGNRAPYRTVHVGGLAS